MEKELYIVRDDYSLELFETKPHLFLNDIWMTDGEVVLTTEAETECSVIVMTMSEH